MDSDLQTAQKVALGTSALALGGAGALTAAGLGGLTVGAAWAAASPYVVAELTDTAIEIGLSTLLGGSIIVPFSPVDVLQDLAKLNARKFAKEGLEGVAESVASKAVRSGDSAGAASSNLVDLSTPARRTHIVDGDLTGGGHRFGTGIRGKSEFPAGSSYDLIMHHISDLATDPASIMRAGRGGRQIVEGMRDGISIRVILDRDGSIITGFPTNVPRNP